MQLRRYQQAAVNAVYDHLRTRDDNPCVVIPTGGGKTPIISQLCRDAVELWNGRVLVLAHVKELLEQTADKLRIVCPQINFGIYSAGLKRRDKDAPVIVAGIQSVFRKACELDAFDLILCDECHLIPIEGDGMYRQFLADAKVINPEVRIVGFTATPYRLKTGPICTPEGFLNHICFEVRVRELIRDGFLCPLISKAGKAKAETSALHIRGGEFISDEVESLMDQDSLVRSACREIMEYTVDRNACLIFASGVQHAQHMVEVFAQEHGVECGFVCGDTPVAERDATLARFKSGDLKYLCNVNVLTTGFDAPHIDCVALVRPTMSPGLFYQMCLDMDTEVLTQSGWRRCHEVTTGDVVAAFDLETEEIEYVPAIDKVHRSLRPEEFIYGISAPHLDVRVTDQHTMIVRARARTCLNWQSHSAADVSKRRETYTLPVAGRGRSYRQDANITDAEVEFIGWFLTDGYMNRSNATATISQSLDKYVSEVRNVLTSCSFGFREYPQVRKGKQAGYAEGVQFVIPRHEGKGAIKGLRGWADLEQWLDKDVPAIFNTLSQRQFTILLGAMNLANGRNAVGKGYVKRVMSIAVGCRQRMADRIQQLAIERGKRCNIAKFLNVPSDWNNTPQPQWMVYVKSQRVAYVGGSRNDSNRLIPNRCRLEPVPHDRNEWVWCLTTEKGTLVTRRNGKVAILGNCGRGFRLHPSKSNCLVLDYGDNIVRHGPVDAIQVIERKGVGGEAPAKECPKCQAVVHAAYTNCPECGFTFPPPEKGRHGSQASDEGILTGDITDTEFEVQDVTYHVHVRRGAPENSPRTMRVDYRVGLDHWKSEWVCIEHSGFARQKAHAWWRQRSPDPFPESAERAVEIANGGGLAFPTSITVRSVAGEKYDRIIAHELGDIPEPVEVESADLDESEVPF